MANVTQVTLTSGVPTAPSGTVSTLDNLIGTAGTPSAQVLTVQGVTGGTGIPVSQATAANLNATVVGTGTFAVQAAATLAAETTKVIGTVNISAAQTIATVTAVTGITNALPAGTNIVGKFTTDQTTHGTTDKVAADLYVGGAATDKGSGTAGSATQRIIVDSSQIGTQQTTYVAASTGYTLVALPNDQVWPKGMSPKGFAAAFTTLTRPANTTAYSAGDSISNNATAASVTALSATVSDTNNDLVTLTDILVTSTDTGLAGKRIRAYLFNSDPTASTGTQAGDNAAFSQKVAGYIGSFSGVLETGFFDGTVGRLVPSFNDSATAPVPNAPAGGLVVSTPTSGAKTLFVVLQTLDAFTPSANSTTLIFTARGFQGRAG